MFELHKKIIQTFIALPTYSGYKGAHILKITTRQMVLAEKIAQWIDDSKLHYKNNVVVLDC